MPATPPPTSAAGSNRPPYFCITTNYTGTLYLEGSGTTDAGAAITATIKTMYSDEGKPFALKSWKWIRIDGVSADDAVTVTLNTKDENGSETTAAIATSIYLPSEGLILNIERKDWIEWQIQVAGFSSIRSITGEYEEVGLVGI